MSHSPYRRAVLLTAAALPFALSLRVAHADTIAASASASANADSFADLERDAAVRLGVFAIDTATGLHTGHREHERFPVCSTFKLILVAAVLARATTDAMLLQRRLSYTQRDVVANSPVSGPHAGDGMTVADLCAAAIQYSDNTAANVLMKMLGGPAAVTAFAHSTGNTAFRLDRWETALNTAIPGDLRDTSTPAAMAGSARTLVLGDALPFAQRTQLKEWLIGNTTGAKRIRAGAPATWTIGDKTGTGDYGTGNDLAVLWPSAEAGAAARGPIALAVYCTQHAKDAAPRDDVIAAAARIALRELG